jgi:hypothetical protein
MRKRNNNYLEQLQKKHNVKSKAPSEMSEAELDAEISKLRGELHGAKVEAAQAARQELASRRKGGAAWLPNKRRRPYWK